MFLPMGRIELNYIYASIYTELFEIELFLTFKMGTYAKLNCLK